MTYVFVSRTSLHIIESANSMIKLTQLPIKALQQHKVNKPHTDCALELRMVTAMRFHTQAHTLMPCHPCHPYLMGVNKMGHHRKCIFISLELLEYSSLAT